VCGDDDLATCLGRATHVSCSTVHGHNSLAPKERTSSIVCEEKSVLEKFLNTINEPTGNHNNISNNNYQSSSLTTISTHPIPKSSSPVINDFNSVMDTTDLIQRLKPDNPFFLFRYREC
jgi:hypothetical protein